MRWASAARSERPIPGDPAALGTPRAGKSGWEFHASRFQEPIHDGPVRQQGESPLGCREPGDRDRDGDRAGCADNEEPPSKNPPNPVPRADLPHEVQPPSETSKVEKDLHKDLASPVIKPNVPTTTTPPPVSPEAAKPGAP